MAYELESERSRRLSRYSAQVEYVRSRPSGYLLPGSSDTNNGGDAPALVASFERSAHDVHLD
jgi:hypothetical protein